MNDSNAFPAAMPACPRLLLLSGSELLESAMRQHLQGTLDH
ncbi:hypothetical protein [Stutzerimonas balearica]|jgi:hypothetical protein|nr:hypothetical protein [Stutzerimonas balearica]